MKLSQESTSLLDQLKATKLEYEQLLEKEADTANFATNIQESLAQKQSEYHQLRSKVQTLESARTEAESQISELNSKVEAL